MLRKTPLHQNHIERGARMGEFASYDMPLFYPGGVIAEHEWVRSSAGLFDVSHMGQILVSGPEEELIAFWERMTPSGFAGLKDGAAKYTVLLNETGGMIDDLIVTRMEAGKFSAVLNAGRKDVDIAWLRKHLPASLTLDYAEEQALIALQGPKAEAVLRDVFSLDLSARDYMSAGYYELDGVQVLMSRLGYTGEDGFELSLPPEKAADVWNKLLVHEAVKPVGLAARDSLRLEIGYPLYGHDISEDTNPVEAGLSWILRKGLVFEAKRRRVGVKLLEKGVAREGAEIVNEGGEKIGVLTSGGFSPSLKESIGMGYVDAAFTEAGTKFFVKVRERNISAVVMTMPFVAAKTKKKRK